MDRVGEDNTLMDFDHTERGAATSLYNDLGEEPRDQGARLIVLDSAHDLFPGNENSRPQVRQFIGALCRLALEVDGAVVLASHPSLHGLSPGVRHVG